MGKLAGVVLLWGCPSPSEVETTMKRLLPLALVALMAAPAAAQSLDSPTVLPGLDNAPPFSADIVIQSPALKQATAYRVYYMPQRIRMEAANAPTVITRMDTGLVYLKTDDHQWMQMSLASVGGAALAPANLRHRVQKLGTANVNGRACDVVRTVSPDGSIVTTNYLTRELPVRSIIQAPSGQTVVDYQNLRVGGVSPAWFEIPATDQVMTTDNLLDQVRNLQRPGVPQ